jgi:hypothetical protein
MLGDELHRCFNHSPLARERRAAARRQGGLARASRVAERKARTSSAPPRTSAAPADAPDAAFTLGPLTDVSEIARAAARVAQAAADGSMGLQRARVILEVLREARAAMFDWKGDVSASDGREATDAELAFIRANGGKAPPGVRILAGPFRVEGDRYEGPPEGAREEAPVEESSNVIPFPTSSGVGSPAA